MSEQVPSQSGGARPDGRTRWKTLTHHGVLLPPPYVPHRRPVLWREPGGKGVSTREVMLPPVAEEMITEFVRRGGTVVASKATLFGKAGPAAAFWRDWRKALPKGCPISSLGGCDLSRIAEVAASLTASAVKFALRKKPIYDTAMVDGAPQPVSPYAVDRPGIFSGRNASPELSGRYRRRITAADVTLNLSKGAPVPPVHAPKNASSPPESLPPKGGKLSWAGVVHDPHVAGVAKWRDPRTGFVKYARLAPASSGEQEADRAKYELARRLHRALPTLRKRIAAALVVESLTCVASSLSVRGHRQPLRM